MSYMSTIKRAVILFAITYSSLAYAEWKVYAEIEGEMTFYYDPTTVKESGKYVKVWAMRNYKAAQKTARGDYFLSQKLQWLFLCKDEVSTIISMVMYSEIDGMGSVVFSGTRREQDYQFEPVAPGTVSEELYRLACKNRR